MNDAPPIYLYPAAQALDDAAVYVVDDDVDDLINRGMVFCPGYWHYDWHGPWHSKLMVFCILLCVGLDLSLLESRAAAASFLFSPDPSNGGIDQRRSDKH